MSKRSEQITDLRPTIPVVHSQQTRSSELFQNTTLRPILKFQNDLIIQAFRHYVFQRKGQFWNLSPKDQLQYIEHSVRKDLRFKALLLGMIVGLFTQEEYERYQGEEAELRRRITDLLVQRLQSQVEQLQKDAAE